jgi:hypothetical protein
MNSLEIRNATSLARIKEVAKSEAENDLSLISAAEILVNIKKLETFLAQYKESVRSMGVSELEKVTEVNGFLVKVEQNSRYAYDGDDRWNELKVIVEIHAGKVKERETFLKSLKTSIVQVDEETGEELRIFPPSKRSSDRITITEIK